ncbi:hypothetical protein GJ496_007030 [Pomphorhynchus laevis]|nr:hypothetical protein GJ496_007030 [Pomphorhynchus laevis]
MLMRLDAVGIRLNGGDATTQLSRLQTTIDAQWNSSEFGDHSIWYVDEIEKGLWFLLLKKLLHKLKCNFDVSTANQDEILKNTLHFAHCRWHDIACQWIVSLIMCVSLPILNAAIPTINTMAHDHVHNVSTSKEARVLSQLTNNNAGAGHNKEYRDLSVSQSSVELEQTNSLPFNLLQPHSSNRGLAAAIRNTNKVVPENYVPVSDILLLKYGIQQDNRDYQDNDVPTADVEDGISPTQQQQDLSAKNAIDKSKISMQSQPHTQKQQKQIALDAKINNKKNNKKNKNMQKLINAKASLKYNSPLSSSNRCIHAAVRNVEANSRLVRCVAESAEHFRICIRCHQLMENLRTVDQIYMGPSTDQVRSCKEQTTLSRLTEVLVRSNSALFRFWSEARCHACFDRSSKELNIDSKSFIEYLGELKACLASCSESQLLYSTYTSEFDIPFNGTRLNLDRCNQLHGKVCDMMSSRRQRRNVCHDIIDEI